MVENIRIRNYKSIVDLTLDLGRFNVIIGTNGCGKSNILEAITMASAASQNKLDAESLKNRGIRETEPQFMMNAFDDIELDSNNSVIQIDIRSTENPEGTSAIIGYSNQERKWRNNGDISDEAYGIIISKEVHEILNGFIEKSKDSERTTFDKEFNDFLSNNRYKDWLAFVRNEKNVTKEEIEKKLGKSFLEAPTYANYISFRPVEKVLRDFNDYTTYPLGNKGEGLFQYLKELSKNENNKGLFEEINKGLKMLDWFDGFNIPDGLLSNEYKLSIGDKFLKDTLHYFDQRSTNEGFLYLLFFLTLFNSKDTPQFFAVDNIETSFNPGLCQSLTKYLIKTTKEKEKQVILTTHNPFVLDGMDLSDDEVRLFVCRRDIDGHTKIERVKYREDRKMPLSELWMSGLIGALPDNF
jgi:AAA15 family ATPase/GTPase